MRSNPQETADLVTFTDEILNGKLDFLCSGGSYCRFNMQSDPDNKRRKSSHSQQKESQK